MEYLFKKIIFVDANKSIREKRISMSRPYNAKQAIALYEKNNPKTLQNSIIFKNNFENIEELKAIKEKIQVQKWSYDQVRSWRYQLSV